MTGIWSEAVAGSGVKRILWKIRELPWAISGEEEKLLQIKFGKLEPRCWSKFL